MKTLYEDLKMLGLMESVELQASLDWYDPEEGQKHYDDNLHDYVLLEIDDFIENNSSIDTWSSGDGYNEPKDYYARLTSVPERVKVMFTDVGEFPIEKLEKLEHTVYLYGGGAMEDMEWKLDVELKAENVQRSDDGKTVTIDYKIETSPGLDEEF